MYNFIPTPRPNFDMCPAVVDGLAQDVEKLRNCSAAEACSVFDQMLCAIVGYKLASDISWSIKGEREGMGAAGPMVSARAQCREDHLAALREAITSPNYSHSRTRSMGGAPFTSIYHRDPTSPSGVCMAESGSAKLVDPLIRELRNNSPLSPTEGLYAPSKGQF